VTQLGSQALFRRLDQDSDGVISAEEANQAKSEEGR
jgi:Ca2+-binding EF-hand superfamily protein